MRPTAPGVPVLAVMCLVVASLGAQSDTWLDRPLQSWNAPGAALPPGGANPAAADDARQRCQLTAPPSAGERALAASGWIPTLHLDRMLVRDDVEILAGASAVDSSCRLQDFNLFVFVGGRFAGTLSPDPMTSGADGSAGAVRFVDDAIAAEFARYKRDDAVCCPTSRMSVRFGIDRSSGGPSIAPIDRRTTRSY